MNHHPNNTPGEFNPEPGRSIPLASAMPAELVGVSRLLDDLAELDRAAAPPTMESRVLNVIRTQATAPSDAVASADVEATDERLDRLAELSRARAASSLEDRIFTATRGIITYQASQIRQPARKKNTFYSSFAFRAAAGLIIGGGIIWTYLSLRPAPTSSPFLSPGGANVTVASLEADIDQRLDGLKDVFALADVSYTEKQSASTETNELGDWPQYQLLEGGDS